MALDDLPALLARERLLLELLLFKLTELRHLLVGGDGRFLDWAAQEVERAVEAVRVNELERAILVQELSDGLPDDADESLTLDRLAETAPELLGAVLREHRVALTALAAEVEAALDAARRLAEAGSTAITGLLDRAGTTRRPVPALLTYGPGSTTSWSAPAPRLRTSL